MREREKESEPVKYFAAATERTDTPRLRSPNTQYHALRGLECPVLRFFFLFFVFLEPGGCRRGAANMNETKANALSEAIQKTPVGRFPEDFIRFQTLSGSFSDADLAVQNTNNYRWKNTVR